MEKIAVIVIGNINSGKSKTWKQLFGRGIRTGEKNLFFNNRDYAEVYLVYGSPKERHLYIGNILGKPLPRIVLCSIQYHSDELKTLQFFIKHNYTIFCHWLNPGYKDANETKTFDDLGLINFLLSNNGMVGIRNGKIHPRERVNEMYNYIYGWATSNKLIKMHI